jgi:phosphopantetheinyl transferase (holo-ACP synthase)
MPFVFTRKEIDFAYTLAHPEASFCRSFCCKEAVYKALKKPYSFTDCELFSDGTHKESAVILSQRLRKEYGIQEARARIWRVKNEYVVTVILFGSGEL